MFPTAGRVLIFSVVKTEAKKVFNISAISSSLLTGVLFSFVKGPILDLIHVFDLTYVKKDLESVLKFLAIVLSKFHLANLTVLLALLAFSVL